jgi:hypothetical protein
MILKERAALADIANALGLTTAVEIGTHQGVFAAEFMERFRGTIHCVDPWESYDGLGKFYPSSDETTTDREQDLAVAVKNLEKFGDRVNFVRQKSEEALGYINWCDFVYIDGLHDYESVSFDIRNWYDKVVSGGIISGHDYHHDHRGVIRAVYDLCIGYSLKINITRDECPSWWAIKP